MQPGAKPHCALKSALRSEKGTSNLTAQEDGNWCEQCGIAAGEKKKTFV